MPKLTSIAREGSTYQVTVAFKDADGDVMTPDTATWTLMDGDKTVVNGREDVAIASPTSEEVIVLGAADLVCSGATAHDQRILFVRCTYDSGKTSTEEFEFDVKALAGV